MGKERRQEERVVPARRGSSWAGGKRWGWLSVPGVIIRAPFPAGCEILDKSMVSHCGHQLLKGAGIVTSEDLSSSKTSEVLSL